MRTALIAALLAIASAGCHDTVIYPRESANPVGPSSPGTTRRDHIEFRVLGNATAARVRHSNSVDGTTQVTTALPYIANFDSTVDSVFLSIEATPTSFPFTVTPFLQAQIFINGTLFRETTSGDFTTISVSGTWRH